MGRCGRFRVMYTLGSWKRFLELKSVLASLYILLLTRRRAGHSLRPLIATENTIVTSKFNLLGRRKENNSQTSIIYSRYVCWTWANIYLGCYDQLTVLSESDLSYLMVTTARYTQGGIQVHIVLSDVGYMHLDWRWGVHHLKLLPEPDQPSAAFASPGP